MRNIFAAAVVVGFGLSMPLAAGADTLADALIAAYKSSHLLDQNQAVLRAADEDAAVAVANLRPVVDYTLQGGFRKYDNSAATSSLPTANFEAASASHNLTATLLIYAGGRARAGVDLAHEAVLATRAGLINVEQSVLLDAVSAYVDLRLQLEIVALRESNTRLITQQMRAAKDRFDVGEVTLTDVSVAEARLAAANAGLAAAQGTASIARERYKAAVGGYPGTLARLPKLPAVPKTLDAARSIAVQNHPFVLQSQHQVKIADLQVAMAKAAYGPTVSGSLGISEDDTGLGNAEIGLRLSQKVYGGGSTSALYRKSLAQKESAAAGLLQTTLAVGENVGRAWAGLAVAHASIAAGGAQVEAAQKAFDGVSEEANLGSRTTLDVLNAEQELLSARASKLEAEASRYVGVYQLLSAMGQLTADKLNLGIPTYDEEAYSIAVKNAPATSAQGAALDRIMSKIVN